MVVVVLGVADPLIGHPWSPLGEKILELKWPLGTLGGRNPGDQDNGKKQKSKPHEGKVNPRSPPCLAMFL